MFYDLKRVTPHVWVHPPSPNPAEVQSAVGVVVSEGETLLIDAGNGPKLARHIQERLEALSRLSASKSLHDVTARCNIPPIFPESFPKILGNQPLVPGKVGA